MDQYLLACVGAGIRDSTVGGDRSTLFEFVRFLGRPVWTAKPADADRFLAAQRHGGRSALTVQKKAWSVGEFFNFLIARHQGDIHELTGHVVEQVIDVSQPSRRP
ncbi:integrase [Salinispora mooreana]|uniref:integrase n=1 Tax=Salinispora mooreana TaxID=999545 RepID=UPI001CC7AF3C|nr:integrase [Salinispora mooreana]